MTEQRDHASGGCQYDLETGSSFSALASHVANRLSQYVGKFLVHGSILIGKGLCAQEIGLAVFVVVCKDFLG